jgi:superfamily I DNA/RNA helicase
LIAEEERHFQEIDLTVSTFGQWSRSLLGNPPMVASDDARRFISRLASALSMDAEFVCDEVDYVLGRFKPTEINNYIAATRVGRGNSPRMPRSAREALILEVINPYTRWKAEQGRLDWNDIAVQLMTHQVPPPLDIVIADETQDFSANQLRAVVNHLADHYSLTVVLDAVQRIYARGFTWAEVGLRPENSYRLSNNYRNTREIARFAASVIQGLPFDDDGSLPDFSSCTRSGPKPTVLKGLYSRQLAYIITILNNTDLDNESVAFLHAKGGGWFDTLRAALRDHHFAFAEITRRSEWPTGPENIALSTLHSAKGLEFDHVYILGLNAETMSHGEEEDDDRLSMLRRLLAMGIGRGKKTVIVGYKPGAASRLIDFFDDDTYDEVEV